MKRLVISVLLVGCGGGGNGTVEVDDLGLELGLVTCKIQFECCTDAEIMEVYMGITYDDQPITTEEQCVAFTNALFTAFAVAQYNASLALGRIEYDGAAAADCVAALDSLTCAEYSTGLVLGSSSGCRPFILPMVGDGGGCTQDYECTSDNCEGASTPLGGPSTDGSCAPLPAAGQACDDNCADGLYCGFDQPSGMDICQALKADGAECSFDDECTTDHCDDTTRMCAMEPAVCDGT